MPDKPVLRIDYPNGAKMVWVDPPRRILDAIEDKGNSPFQKPEMMSGYPLDPEEQATVDRIASTAPRFDQPLPGAKRFFRSAAFPIIIVMVLAFIAQRLIGG